MATENFVGEFMAREITNLLHLYMSLSPPLLMIAIEEREIVSAIKSHLCLLIWGGGNDEHLPMERVCPVLVLCEGHFMQNFSGIRLFRPPLSKNNLLT